MRRVTEKQRHALDLLCRAGAGLAPIAPQVCGIVRTMVGADACALFWLDAQGLPEGFFHEHSPQQAQDLFLNEYERLFVGPAEINVTSLARGQGTRTGHLLAPPSSYYRSNTFNLLVRASGHHHSLDLRVDVEGRPRAVLLLFRTQLKAFDEGDAALLRRVEPYLRRACSLGDTGAWRGPASRMGHVLLADDGQQLLMLSGEAEALLKDCALSGQDIRLAGPLQVVPRFLRDLCARMAAAGQPVGCAALGTPLGRLQATAHRLHAPASRQGIAGQTLVTLELLQSPRLHVVQQVLDLQLSPLQREIALLAGVGGARGDCEAVIGVGREALKKHLAVIYRAAGVQDWAALAKVLDPAG